LVSHIIDYLKLVHDVASDAERASQKLFQSGRQYRAVIIDLALPGKDGWTLLQEIRENAAAEGLTCIAVIAYHTSKTREEALRSGFNAYFPKPLDALL
jgi:CheY-like chemotaxis protein